MQSNLVHDSVTQNFALCDCNSAAHRLPFHNSFHSVNKVRSFYICKKLRKEDFILAILIWRCFLYGDSAVRKFANDVFMVTRALQPLFYGVVHGLGKRFFHVTCNILSRTLCPHLAYNLIGSSWNETVVTDILFI